MTRDDQEPLPFWFGKRQGATDEELDFAERYVGRALPGALRSLLMLQNGGVSNFDAYVDGEAYYPLLPFFGVDPDAAAGTLMRAFDVRKAFGVPDGVVVFAGEGHAWWGLDYRNDSVCPTVVYRNNEQAPVETVASSFEAFLKGLSEE